MVDSVQDVVDVTADDIRPAPAMSGNSTGEFIQGIVTLDQCMLILLKVNELVLQEMPTDSPASTAA